MRRPVLIDTGPIVAILSSSDANHSVCVEQVRRLKSPLITCWPVITEAAWLLRSYPRAVELLFSSVTSGAYNLASLDRSDLPGITAILRKYKDLGIQLADACLVHLADRENIETIFTLDRRDFSVIRLGRRKKLSLLPN